MPIAHDTILLSTHSPITRASIGALFAHGPHLHIVDVPADLWPKIKSDPWDCLFIDLARMERLSESLGSTASPKAVIDRLKTLKPNMAIIVIAEDADIRKAVSYVKYGASNYVTVPINEDEIRLVLDEIAKERLKQSEIAYLRAQVWQDESTDIVQTLSSTMKKVHHNVMSVGPTKTTVLLLGETGTGKSHLARRIHRFSNRKNGPFISVHCGAIPETLVESELFGHEKGSFTGAHRRKLGKFEVASGGTIFLDEIGTISKSAQVKLLTILQEGTYQRVGGEQPLKADVRVIAASNSDLKQMCDEGFFRKDLYYRLNVFPITVPQLHERKEDVQLFVKAFIKKFNRINTKAIGGVHHSVMAALEQYNWPGNIRELENLLERAYILETTSELTPESFPSELFESVAPITEIAIDTSETLVAVRKKGIAEIERRYLKELLARNRGRINASASEAGIGTRQLNKLMHKYNLDKGLFKSTTNP
jgi:DNA-binding NtrC family response regulator